MLMSKEEISRLIFEGFNRRDFSVVDPYFDEALVLDFPGVKQMIGKRRVLIFLGALLRRYPELVFEVHDVIISSNRSVVIWTNKGRDASGGDYSNSGNSLVHFENEKIVFMSDYFKDTSFINS